MDFSASPIPHGEEVMLVSRAGWKLTAPSNSTIVQHLALLGLPQNAKMHSLRQLHTCSANTHGRTKIQNVLPGFRYIALSTHSVTTNDNVFICLFQVLI